MSKPSSLKRGFIVSFSIHLILMILMALPLIMGGGKGEEGENGGGGMDGQKDFGDFVKPAEEKEVTVEIITLPKKPEKSEEDAIEEDEEETKEPAEETGDICHGSASYGGVGVTFNFDGEVVEAPEWYPAYKSGIRIGDKITWSDKEIRGEPGSTVTVRVRHKDGGTEEIVITRGKICYQDIGNHNGGTDLPSGPSTPLEPPYEP